jgi:hypothetical protein
MIARCAIHAAGRSSLSPALISASRASRGRRTAKGIVSGFTGRPCLRASGRSADAERFASLGDGAFGSPGDGLLAELGFFMIAGKTLIATQWARLRDPSPERPLWFIVHRRELFKQTVAAFEKAGFAPGAIAAGEDETPGAAIQICMVQTLAFRGDQTRTAPEARLGQRSCAIIPVRKSWG